jgi:hypothetical protein
MIQPGRRLGLAHESFTHIRSEREIRWKQLDRDFALEAGVAGAIDDAGAAASNLVLKLICRSEPPLDAQAKVVFRS